MGSLLEQFVGKIDLIYIDPPFATGADFSIEAKVGESGEKLPKEQTVIEEKAYRDTWRRSMDSYITMMYERLEIMRELLSENGSIYVHCDWRINSQIRLVLDDIFGSENFLNEIIWFYGLGGSTKRLYSRKHDIILFYSKGAGYTFHKPLVPATSQLMKGKMKGAPDVWDIPSINNMAKERTDYPTQKPIELLERIIEASSNEGSLVADFFCGSGTTAYVAEKLGRRWIACDLGRWGVHTTRKRMLGIKGCKPFEVLNLGKYERQHWHGVTFSDKSTAKQNEQIMYRYLAFILKLYGAQPMSNMGILHGRKGKALIHIGMVDAPVTINEINEAVDECVKRKQKVLHILGWEWEMGLNDLVIQLAKTKNIKLSLFYIPREVMEQQAIDRGDVSFYELAYLDAEVITQKKSAKVQLRNFAMPEADTISDDIKGKITKWSDYIDYWAVDWNFQNDTFMQGWVTYRTREDRKLSLLSDTHSYTKKGKYQVLIKVIDIFGNDTSTLTNIQVK